MILTATSLRESTRRLWTGFGILRGLGGGSGPLRPLLVDRLQGCMVPEMRGRIIFVGFMPAFPTSDRLVSGRKSTIARRQVPDATAKNQKIHRQPGPAANAPPIAGPILGAVLILPEGNLMSALQHKSPFGTRQWEFIGVRRCQG